MIWQILEERKKVNNMTIKKVAELVGIMIAMAATFMVFCLFELERMINEDMRTARYELVKEKCT